MGYFKCKMKRKTVEFQIIGSYIHVGTLIKRDCYTLYYKI